MSNCFGPNTVLHVRFQCEETTSDRDIHALFCCASHYVNTRVSASLQRLVAKVSLIHQDRLIQTLTVKIKGQLHPMNPDSDRFVVRVAGCRDELTGITIYRG